MVVGLCSPVHTQRGNQVCKTKFENSVFVRKISRSFIRSGFCLSRSYSFRIAFSHSAAALSAAFCILEGGSSLGTFHVMQRKICLPFSSRPKPVSYTHLRWP